MGVWFGVVGVCVGLNLLSRKSPRTACAAESIYVISLDSNHLFFTPVNTVYKICRLLLLDEVSSFLTKKGSDLNVAI